MRSSLLVEKLRFWQRAAEKSRSRAAPVDYVILRYAADKIEAVNDELSRLNNIAIELRDERDEAREAARFLYANHYDESAVDLAGGKWPWLNDQP